MNRDERLAAVLAEFARTMLTDFPIQGILDRLVERIVDVLPVDAAGVTLISDADDPHFLAASDEAARSLERLQSSLGAGPCVTANGTGLAVIVPEVATDSRYPDFVTAAADVGVAAVFAFPLHHGDGRLGALDLFRQSAGPLDDWAMSAAQTLADVAAAYVLNAQSREESRAASEELLATTLHDGLTGLPNRAMLQQRLEHAAERAQRTLAPAAVLFADLDGFKQVNDTHGHPVGDALLVAVARRLSGLLRPGDTLARVSGDEFVVLCEDLKVVEDVDTLLVRIGEAFQTPFSISVDADSAPVELRMSASVGIAFAGGADQIGPGLIHRADQAMYRAKRRSATVSRVVVDLPDAARAAERMQLHSDLREALERGRLALAYQPIVRCSDGSVTGVEALLRWTHPQHGAMAPPSVVRLAERHALISELGRWVLERGMRDRAHWLREHPERPLGLAVNVSGRQLLAPGLPETVSDLLGKTGMQPGQLTLEMTESIFLDDSTMAAGALAGLRELGIRLALDDFGTGYSSLGYLRRLPVDVVKIDQDFIRDIGADPTGGAVVQAVTSLAHVLGLQVTAKGVETAQERDQVASVGCESAQGFHFAPPMSAEELRQALQASRGSVLRLPEPRQGEPSLP